MSTVRAVFLDDGGVLNDNGRRGAEWRRLVGAFFAPRLGGAPEAWSRANVGAAERSWARFLAARDDAAGPANDAFIFEDAAEWLADMATQVGVASPPRDEASALAREGQLWVCEHVRAAYTDVVPAVRALAARGLLLHTASGALSRDLDGYLRGMRIRELFGSLYGPDLVGSWKRGPDFYRAIFMDSGVEPAEACVVDDFADAIAWAREVGATGFHLARAGGGDLRSLSELAGRLV